VSAEVKVTGATPNGPAINIGHNPALGSEASRLGDLNQDGIDELVVGALFDGPVGGATGSVFVLFMNAAGGVDSTKQIGSGIGGFPDVLTNQSRFGEGLAPLGDLDGDEVPDLAIGQSYYHDALGDQIGAVWIAYMNRNGTVRNAVRITDGESGFTASLAHNDDFGVSLACLGRVPDDVAGDSLTVLAVGAHGDQDGAIGGEINIGAVYILRVQSDGLVAGYQKISQTAGGLGPVLAGHDDFGEAVASLGDLNHDGYADLAVGSLEIGRGPGAVWILFLDSNWEVQDKVKITKESGGFDGKIDLLDYFGVSLAPLGDLHGDGTFELAVGSGNDDDGGYNRGAIWILSLRPDGTVLCSSKISQFQGGFAGPLHDSDGLGNSLAAVSVDASGGSMRLACGAFYDDTTGPNDGAVWFLDVTLPTVSAVPTKDTPYANVLEQNRPNPFRGSTKIQFSVPSPGPVGLSVFDVAGRLVRELAHAQMEAGTHELTWDGRDAHGALVPSGIYFYQLTVAGRPETRKMILSR